MGQQTEKMLYQLEPLKNNEKEEYINKYLLSTGIPFDKQNIKDYCMKNSNITQRNVESDMIRCIARWIDEGKSSYILEHIKSM